MAQASQQAAGAAVGAAIGFVVTAGNPAGAIMGGQLGAAGVGAVQSKFAGDTQGDIDEAALNLNLEQARLSAAEKSAALARNFRKSLASQIAIASMRGGAGSLVAQFGSESFQNYMEDKSAIEAGLAVSETQGSIGKAKLKADANTRDIKSFGNFASSSFDAVNFSNLLKGSGSNGGGK